MRVTKTIWQWKVGAPKMLACNVIRPITSVLVTSIYYNSLWGRGGRIYIVISDAVVGHNVVDIVVADPARRDFVERAAREDLGTATDAEQREETTIGIAQSGRHLCSLLPRRTVHCLIGRIGFW